MNPHTPHSLLAPFHRLFADERRRQATDGDLLRAFVQRSEGDAFAELLRRHAPMVLRLGLHVLHHQQDAEDVFQATFLTLARKASSLRNESCLAGWLHRVAWRLALRSRAARRTVGVSRMAAAYQPADAGRSPDVTDEISLRESLELLHQELAALPERLRLPLVLCYLQGRTRDEAAHRLGWSLGTLKRRLEQGRQLLHARLSRRGVTLSAVLATSLLASAEVSPTLAEGTLRLAASCLAGSMTMAPASVAALVNASSSVKMKALCGLVVLLGACVGTGSWVYPGRADDPATSGERCPPNPSPHADKREKAGDPAHDLFGDPLPSGAVARLGTVHLRHADYLHALGFTPDGKTLISMGCDGVRVWDAATGKPVRHFGAGILPRSIALSPDGRRVAVSRYHAGIGGPVEVWDVAAGKLLHKRGNRHYIRVRFSADGQRVAALESHHEFPRVPQFPWHIDIWNAATGERVVELAGETECLRDMSFSADGKTLLLGGGKVITVRDAVTGKEVRRLGELPADLHSFVLSPHGDRIAFFDLGLKKQPSGTINWTSGVRVFLLDARTGAEQRRWSVKPVLGSSGLPENGWWSLAFSPDGRRLAACQQNGSVHVWDIATGAEKRLLADGRTHSGGVAFSPDGKTLAVGDSGRVIRIIDADNGRERVALKGHRGSVTALAAAPDGRTVFTATEEGMIHRWDTRTGRELHQYLGHKRKVDSLALSADGKKLCSLGYDNMLYVWGVDSGKEHPLRKNVQCFHRLALSFDGKMLAVPGQFKELHLINPDTGELLHKLTTKTRIIAVAFSADGSQVLALTGGRTICRWQTASGRRLPDGMLPAEPELPYVNADVWPADEIWMPSPEGRFAAHAFSDKFLRVLDMDTRRQVHRTAKLPGEVSSVAFAPGGRTLVWSEKSGRIHWLEMATWSERRLLPGHAGAIEQMVFSADGKRLVSGSDDGTALVWDLLRRELALLSAQQRAACWIDLTDKDAAKAYHAMCRLLAAPADTVVDLRSRIKPVVAVDEKHVQEQIAGLDSEVFAVREKATEALRRLGELAEPALRKALAARTTLEMRRRSQELVEEIQQRQWQPASEILRQLRAVEVLEHLGTTEAKAVLQSWTEGAAGARLTREARAALQRLKEHQEGKP